MPDPGRARTEAAFAALAGTFPVPALSGSANRRRLNRGVDRQLNRVVCTLVLIRTNRDPAIREYLANGSIKGEPRRESSAFEAPYFPSNLPST
ncbi:transposase [Arthrobacter alpinus]|uniref:transposase n=1 Tax=Arthrobacter alpinus TaxID=656366 RepID=UPI00094468E9